MNRVLVAGLGNEMRGDDAAGLLTARVLRMRGLPGVDVEEHGADAARLAESLAAHDLVFVIDAVVAKGVRPGSILIMPPKSAAARARFSSHGLGLAEALALVQAVGGNPSVEVFGIAGDRYNFGAAPSAAIVRAAAEVARRIEERLSCA